MKWHPDKNKSPHASEEFIKICYAYKKIINIELELNINDLNINDFINHFDNFKI